ncbi:MAG: histidine kinase [Chthoniobacterales bacterium]
MNPATPSIPSADFLFRGWSRVSLFWKLQIGGWTAFAIFSFPLKWVVLETVPGSVIVSLYRDGLGFLMTIAMREIYRRLYRRGVRLRWLIPAVAAVSIGAGGLLTWFSLAFHGLFDFYEEKIFTTQVVFGIFYFRTGLFAAWSALYFGIRRIQDAREGELRLAHAESRQREAELQMLRSQMNPHFLFNALNTIRTGIETGSKAVVSQIDALAGYLQFSLAQRRNHLVSIGDEFDAVVDYLTVERARYRDELQVETWIDENARGFPAPGITLQTLVENAVKHRRQTSRLPLIVRLSVTIEDGCLIIQVANTGHWIEPRADDGASGVGLENLQRRLALIYEGREHFETNEKDGWVLVQIRIPKEP